MMIKSAQGTADIGNTGMNNTLEFGMNREYKLSFFVLLLMTLLMICIACSHVIVYKLKLNFLSEPGGMTC